MPTCGVTSSQAEEHADTLKQLRSSHTDEVSALQKALDAETASREATERKLAQTEAAASKTIKQLRADLSALENSNVSTERQLRDSAPPQKRSEPAALAARRFDAR